MMSELNRFTSPQEATGATPAPLGTSVQFCNVCEGLGEVGLDGCPSCNGSGEAAPAGLPLHEPTDRDGGNVPSDRVRAYAEAIASVMGVQTRYLDPRLARAVMAVADREQAELLAEIARLRGEIDAWKTVVENDTSIQGAMRRTISRVASVCDDWQSGHEPVHHRGYIADLERALRGPEPTEEPR